MPYEDDTRKTFKLAAWLSTAKTTGKKYFNGYDKDSGIRIAIFRVEEKKTDRSPDLSIVLDIPKELLSEKGMEEPDDWWEKEKQKTESSGEAVEAMFEGSPKSEDPLADDDDDEIPF